MRPLSPEGRWTMTPWQAVGLLALLWLVPWAIRRRANGATNKPTGTANRLKAMGSLGACDRHPSALARWAAVNGLLEIILCNHCAGVHSQELQTQGFSLVDADECDTEGAL